MIELTPQLPVDGFALAFEGEGQFDLEFVAGEDHTVALQGAATFTLTFATAAEFEVELVPALVGERGAQGIPGDAAQSHEESFSAALVWTVNHNLGRIPSVTIRSVGGVVVIADIVHFSINQFQVEFAAPFAGSVYCI